MINVSPEEIRERLRQGIVEFSYEYNDPKKQALVGNREAVGTLKMDLIPQSDHPKGIKPRNPLLEDEQVCYYDLGAGGWRTFKVDLLREFDK